MALYLVESYDHQVIHGSASSEGVVGQGGASEKIYLHVIDVSDGDVARLAPREDENGNQQHDRLALPRNEEWWIAIEGEKIWPRTVRPKLTSHCRMDERGVPRPVPLASDDLATLRKLGARLP